MQHLNYSEFIETVKEHIQRRVEKQVYIQPVLKNNGTSYDGLVILDPILNISPTIYLNSYYSRYLEGTSLEEICDDILQTYHKNLPEDDFDVSVFRDFEKAKDRIIMKLINAKQNEALLQWVPHILMYDLAIVFLCTVNEFMNEFATILIYHPHLSLWNICTKDLYEIAKTNTPKLLPPRLDNLHDVFAHITDVSLSFLEELNMSILTNPYKIYGATCMLYPDLLEHISDFYEDDVMIIPSSIHEVLVYPKKNFTNEYSTDDLNNIIQEVNQTQLSEDEILSDHLYCYSRESKEIIYL